MESMFHSLPTVLISLCWVWGVCGCIVAQTTAYMSAGVLFIGYMASPLIVVRTNSIFLGPHEYIFSIVKGYYTMRFTVRCRYLLESLRGTLPVSLGVHHLLATDATNSYMALRIDCTGS